MQSTAAQRAFPVSSHNFPIDSSAVDMPEIGIGPVETVVYHTLAPWHAAGAYSGSRQFLGTYSAAGTVDSLKEAAIATFAYRTAAVKRSEFPTLVLALRTDPAATVLLHSAFLRRSREILRHTKRSILCCRCRFVFSTLSSVPCLHCALIHQLQEIHFQFVHAPHLSVCCTLRFDTLCLVGCW